MPSNKQYDVIVIGSGLGGLLTAVLLAKEGMKVCVLERNKQIGGCLQTFALDKKVFDSCVHYIGGLGEGHTLNKIFSYAGIMNKLELNKLNESAFDEIAFSDDDTTYPLAQGLENFQEQLLEYFPNERTALEKHIKAVRNVGDHFPLYRLRYGDASEKYAVSDSSIQEVISSITSDKRLQNVLTGNNLLYAGEPDKTPFYIHALITESYIHSAHKVVPGSSMIAKYLWQELQKHGGEIFREEEVVSLIEENGNITYAETKTGNRFYAKQFIANIHPQQLLDICDSKLLRAAYRKRINELPQTIPAFMMNVSLKAGTVPIRHNNLYWHKTNDAWSATNYKPEEWPANYAVYYTQDRKNPEYAESISVLAYMHYDEVKQWQDSHRRAGYYEGRDESYQDFKKTKEEILLNKVNERIPSLKNAISKTSSATPLTYRDYTATPEGSLYGIMKNVNKPAETTIPTRTKIPNLLLTGQNVNLHGVLGVSITALSTAGELVGLRYLLGKINSA